MAFTAHPLFQESAPAAHIAIDKFYKEYKDFKGPTQSFLLAGLAANAKDACPPSIKRGKILSLTFHAFHRAFCLTVAEASVSSTGLLIHMLVLCIDMDAHNSSDLSLFNTAEIMSISLVTTKN